MREDRIDAGLIVLPVDCQPGLYTHLLVDGDMRVALPEGHRLARHARLRLEQLAGEPWLLFPRHYGPGMHDLIVAACAAAGFVPEVVQEARQMQTIAGLVAGGIGVAPVPSLLQPLRRGHLRPLQGRRARIPYRLALAYRTPSDLIERFRETAQTIAAAPAHGLAPVPERLLGRQVHRLGKQPGDAVVHREHRLVRHRQESHPPRQRLEQEQVVLAGPQPAPEIDPSGLCDKPRRRPRDCCSRARKRPLSASRR